jgi:uncharacterized protein
MSDMARTMAVSQKPLDDDERSELRTFLSSDAMPDDSLDFSGLHGLLTAVISGPETVMPSEWFPIVIGTGDPAFTDKDQAERIFGLVMRFYNEVASVLAEEPEIFDPIMLGRGGTDSRRPYAMSWCRGYLFGVKARQDAWLRYQHEPVVADGLAVIAALIDDLPGQPLPRGIRRADLRDVLFEAAYSIYDFFENIRRRERTVHRSSPRVGRNAPCPCGSGKKFKVCCGAA